MTEKNKPSYFYMANLGSEIERILRWENSDKNQAVRAAERALGIIKKALSLPEIKGREKEFKLFEEIIKNFLNKGRIGINKKESMSYFIPFALKVISNSSH